ncbi:MAG: hypothetical protein B6242_16075 [Anaerolineaceae bacterium 4572_78]|nr:MAG: hypothetical protein B6242_16075 [Anaerolineaceae bacterium 4572_78]
MRKLTHGIDPAFSPSGRQVAFTRWEEPSKFSLWKINLDGHGETHIFGNTKQAKSPTWSPDESKIAINFQHGGTLKYTKECDPLESEWSLNPWLVDLRDEDALEFVPDINEETGELEGIDVCWKNPPDAHWKLRVIDITSQTHEDVNIGNYIFRPDWNPINPNQIISSGGIGLVIAEFQDAGKQVALPLTTDAGDRSPSYSPDGRYIVLNYHQRPNWDIHRLNADGTGRVRLTKTPLYVTAVEKKPLWNNVSPVFSPDGSQIAFLTDRNERWEIWVMGMDGSNQRQMFPDSINDQLPILYNMVDERVFDWTYIF